MDQSAAAGSGDDSVCVLGVLSDGPLRAEGLRALLELHGAYRVVPLVHSEDVALTGVALVLLDVETPAHLLALLRELRRARPSVPVLVLGSAREEPVTMEVLRLGAKGYLHHAASEAELRMAVQVVLEGSVWAPRRVLARLLAEAQASRRKEPALTSREEEVLRLLAGGRTNRAIAEALGLDERTVKAHLSRLMQTLGVRNRVGLTLCALRQETVPSRLTS